MLPPSIERLFEDHHDRVFRAAYRVTGNRSDAEDVLQTIFLRLMRRAEPPDLRPSPGSYLHRAAINAALDIVRSRNARNVPLDDASELDAPAGERPDEQHLGRELEQRLRRAVAELSPRAAEMFALRYFEGRDLKQVAAALGTSRSVVAVTMFRTRSKLKHALEHSIGEAR